MTDPNLVYTYAVLRRTPEATAAVTHLRGVAGEPVHLVDPAEGTPQLSFAVGHVPAADYDETPLKAHLDDLDWLESTVRSHHAVVAALVGCGAAVLPLRLATVYHDEDRARQALDTRRDYFLSLLHRLTGHVELGVKIYATPDITPPEADTGAGQEQPTGLGATVPICRSAAADNAGTRRPGAESPRRPHTSPRRPPPSPWTAWPTARNAAASRAPAPAPTWATTPISSPCGRVDAFRTGILAAAEGVPGLRVEVTGPWAPYSFALQPEPGKPRDRHPLRRPPRRPHRPPRPAPPGRRRPHRRPRPVHRGRRPGPHRPARGHRPRGRVGTLPDQ